MCLTLDRFFLIKDIVDSSEVPMTAHEIAAVVDISLRTILRHISRLAKEGLVDLKVRKREEGSGITGHAPYEYARKGFWRVQDVR